MPNENSKTPATQNIPLSKIHDLPGVFITKPQDKSLGGLVTSIQSGGVKEAVILRRRDDGEYELLSGYRRRRASELAKKQDIPALVYEMSLDDARKYFRAVKDKPDTPIPGKLIDPAEDKGKDAAEKLEKPAEPVKDDKAKTEEKATAAEKKDEAKPSPAAEKAVEPVADKAVKPAEAVKDDKAKTEEKAAAAEKKDEAKPTPAAEKAAESAKDKQDKPAAVVGTAAAGPAGTVITQVFDERLAPPTEKDLKDLPQPKEGESFFIKLHPAYLEKSVFNTFSVDKNSENFKELKKSIELSGIKDPVLARIKPEGGLEIVSGQRRHLAAMELNYPVPTIIQKIDDADAKIIVADGNLHRDKISSYDMSRALRMKMEGMKQKAGRRKKGYSADELNSDEKLAAEMGMNVSKLNRFIRLSEAIKEVCDRVDDESLPLSIAAEISFLKPENQEQVIHLSDLGYKLTNDRVKRIKKAETSGTMPEMKMRSILEDKDIAPKQTPPAPAPAVTPTVPTTIPASPDVKPTEVKTAELPAAAPAAQTPTAGAVPPSAPSAETVKAGETPAASDKGKQDDPFVGKQERPETTKVILAGDRLRKYFPDVEMTPREIEESIYDALEERRVRQMKQKEKEAIFKKSSPTRK